MTKQYEITEEKPCTVSKVAVAYANTRTAQAMVKGISMPCTFTDEEFKEELMLSETSGFVSDEDFKKHCFEKWGIAL